VLVGQVVRCANCKVSGWRHLQMENYEATYR
jgi:hypothetical protein